MVRTVTCLLCCFISIISLSAQTLTVTIPEGYFDIDHTNDIIVSRLEQIENYANLENYDEVLLIFDQTTYHFSVKPDSLVYSSSYQIYGDNNIFTLYFTPLPLLSIVSNTQIIDEPKVPAFFTYADEEQLLTSVVGIELRGGSSLFFPKKTYDLEFWEDPSGVINKDVQFGNMREDDDWILDGLYNEPLRMRSHLAHKLWLEMHTPYYQEQEEKARAGADVEFVEVFVNGVYQGLYNLSEQVDRKLLKLKKFTTEIRGELYKGVGWGATTFDNLPDYNNDNRLWGGYELRYPDRSDTTEWKMVYDYTDFCINASNDDFSENIFNYLQQDNYIDYFIFLNFLRASDNTGKNIFLSKYKQGEPYFFVPWDLDGVLGTNWQGERDPTTIYPSGNVMNSRIIDLNADNYAAVIEARWLDLREDILNTEVWQNRILDQFNFFTENKIYEREAIVFPNYDFDEDDLNYLQNWLNGRIGFLDTYFEDTVSTSLPEENEVYLFPNPSREKVFIRNIRSLENSTYRIIGQSGVVVQDGEITGDSIPLGQLPPGKYFVYLNNKIYQLVVHR